MAISAGIGILAGAGAIYSGTKAGRKEKAEREALEAQTRTLTLPTEPDTAGEATSAAIRARRARDAARRRESAAGTSPALSNTLLGGAPVARKTLLGY
jgi:hypothetical protein